MHRNIRDVGLPLIFPPTFKWGSATAPHQVEGSPNSNWGAWERSERRIKELDDKGKDLHQYISGRACEFDDRFREDMGLARTLGHNALRLGVNWATVEPRQGEFDRSVLELYRTKLLTARRLQLEPVLTLYHWTHPDWFENTGSWKRDDAPELFARYVEETLKYVGDQVTFYTVLNEPNVYGNFSFRYGQWPPQERDEAGFQSVMKNLAEAHRRADNLILEVNQNAMVGIAQGVNWNESSDPELKALHDSWSNDFVDSIMAQLDFIGVNVYMHCEYEHGEKPILSWEGNDPCTENPVRSGDLSTGEIGGAMCPRALYEVVKEYSGHYPLPIMVTEHGHAIPEMEDNRRCWYIWESLKWLHKAVCEDGVELLGYLHWALLDDFEWGAGFDPKFGLIHVDRSTMVRTPRKSAYLLRDIISAGGLTEEIALRYRDLIKHPNEK